MQITALKIQSGNIHAQQDFYGGKLGLPSRIANNKLSIQIGSSQLIFTNQTDFTGRYHFAFTIPKNQFDADVKWLEQRTPIVSDINGNTQFKTGE